QTGRRAPDSGARVNINHGDLGFVSACGEDHPRAVPRERRPGPAAGMSVKRSYLPAAGAVDSRRERASWAAGRSSHRPRRAVTVRDDVDNCGVARRKGAAPEDAAGAELYHPQLAYARALVHAPDEDSPIIEGAASRNVDPAILRGSP